MNFNQAYNDALKNSNNLHDFIELHFDKIYDYYSLTNHEILSKNRNEFRNLVLNLNTIRKLNFEYNKNEAYLNLILNTSVRLGDLFVFQQFNKILEENKLYKSNILQASTLFMVSQTSNDFVDVYVRLLYFLDEAYKNDTDDNKESIAIFIYYYSLFIKYFAEFALPEVLNLKEKITKSYHSKKIGFLDDGFIEEILSISIEFKTDPYTNIQKLLDQFLNKYEISTSSLPGFLLEQNTDYAQKIKKGNLSISEIQDLNKQLYMPIRSNEIFYSLGRGTAILASEKQLYAYMFAHGKKHIAKLEDAFKCINSNDLTNVKLIDWGCGQGIATKMFLDVFGCQSVHSSILIEPSECALKRAALHINNDVESITTINKSFDELKPTDIKEKSSDDITYVHFFSNVIDMDFFNLSTLISNIEQSFIGIQYIVVCSPYINVAKTERINLFISKLMLNNGIKLLEETIHKGNWINGWSKVIRVIKIEL